MSEGFDSDDEVSPHSFASGVEVRVSPAKSSDGGEGSTKTEPLSGIWGERGYYTISKVNKSGPESYEEAKQRTCGKKASSGPGFNLRTLY